MMMTPLGENHRTHLLVCFLGIYVRELMAALELRRGWREGGPGTHWAIDPHATQPLLDEADTALRSARDCYQAWPMGRQAVWEPIPELAARSIVMARQHRATDDEAIIQATQDMLTQRGRSARALIDGLGQILGRTWAGLPRRTAAPLAKVEGAPLHEVKLDGRPVPNLDRLRAKGRYARSWWTRLAPGLAARSIRNDIRERLGPVIRETVEFYDRQLQAWIKAGLDRLVEHYESQAEPIREQVRRLRGTPEGSGDAEGRDQGEADLRALRQVMSAAPALYQPNTPSR
ncbi:MAG: hypothetical protein IRY99_18580 [Isosphaeraceae bacterium]|nr:hypothetical protein [Isosphaeraceae bacterium]